MSSKNEDNDRTDSKPSVADENDTCVSVVAGICGFTCSVRTRRLDKHKVSIDISQSDCGQIQRLSKQLTEMTLRELFTPVTRNPAYVGAEKSGCHSSCVIPAAVLKAAEVAMEMALAKDVCIRFQPCVRSGSVT